jgi:molybdopterin synthase catalytic subunit
VKSKVEIGEADFDVGLECRQLAAISASSGAIAQFVGVMRDHNQGDSVVTMELEHYPGMTENSIARIIDRAAERWPLLAATVIHRVGVLRPCEQIVFVGVCSPHRHDAFQACEFVMDYLKTEAPFWKKEYTVNGQARWLDARSSDSDALARWQAD